jgi:hypothetical protein
MRKAGLLGLLVSVVFVSCSERKEYNVRNCSKIWEGNFYNLYNGEVDTEISRHGNLQAERYKDGSTCNLKVEWLDSCRYRLTYLSGNEKMKNKDLRPVIVQITGVKENSYTVEGWVEGSSFGTYTSEVFKRLP